MNKVSALVLLLNLMLTTLLSQAQTSRQADSLLNILATQDDSAKAITLSRLGDEAFNKKRTACTTNDDGRNIGQ